MFPYTRIEQKVIIMLEKHIDFIFGIAVTFLAIIVRLSMFPEISGDMAGCLIPWFEDLREMGGLHGLSASIGDYNIPYLVIMALLTYLPFNPVYMIKMVSVFFDIVMIFSFLKLADEIFNIKREKGTYLILYSVIVFLPTVILNSSCWGQCDSVYTAFCILTIVYICKENYRMAFIFYGIAFAFKLQSVFLLPILLILYVRKKFSILYFFFVPAINIILCLPAIIAGRPVKDVFLIYGKQMVAYPEMSLNYPNIYQIIQFPRTVGFMSLALSIALLLLGVYAYIIVRNKMNLHSQDIVRGSIWCVWTCCMFLPMMHERYSYMMEVLLILYAFMTKKIK